MSLQLVPEALQRRHWEAYVRVGVPVQAPRSALSSSPSRAVPETVGAAVLTGGVASTRPVCGDVAVAEPAALVAVTAARTVPATSAGVRRYVAPVAPAMSAQL